MVEPWRFWWGTEYDTHPFSSFLRAQERSLYKASQSLFRRRFAEEDV
jgi:hypothetical protein